MTRTTLDALDAALPPLTADAAILDPFAFGGISTELLMRLPGLRGLIVLAAERTSVILSSS